MDFTYTPQKKFSDHVNLDIDTIEGLMDFIRNHTSGNIMINGNNEIIELSCEENSKHMMYE